MLEISSLVRHGYCVGRKACRARPDLFGTDLPGDAPWDPVPGPRGAAPSVPVPLLGVGAKAEPAAATVQARTLQASALRRIWSTLLDYRDWVSYLYVPILVPILVLMPYVAFKAYQRSHWIRQLVESLSQGSRDLEQMSRLLDGPMTPWTGEPPEEVLAFDEPDLTGFKVLQDMRILDFRIWKPAASEKSDPSSLIYGYRRLKVFKKPEHAGNNIFRMSILPTSPETQVRFPLQQLQPKLRRSKVESSIPGQKECRWEASFDLEKVPVGEYVDLIYEHISPGLFVQRGETSTTLAIEMQAETAEVTRWVLLPRGKEYKNFRVVRYKKGKPGTVEVVKIVTEYLAEDSTILAYKLLSTDPGYIYEVTWYYK
jgi:hypothetical protein